MPLFIVSQDITRMKVDAIVNAANRTLLGGGGVDGAIHRAAGPELKEECRTLGGCETGDARITGAYALPCRYVIHTVGPVWYGGNHNEEKLLYSCYIRSLELAVKNGCGSVAFPLISSGAFGYPRDKAFGVAIKAVSDFLNEYSIDVYLTVIGDAGSVIGREIYAEISSFIARNQEKKEFSGFGAAVFPAVNKKAAIFERKKPHSVNHSADSFESEKEPEKIKRKLSGRSSWDKKDSAADEEQALYTSPIDGLDEKYLQLDESFSQMLLRIIDEKGMKDSECYKKANVDRKLFSKIRSDPAYRPSKITAIAFAIALELSLDETKDLLMKAGFALSHSSKFDLIIEFFITRGNYDIFEINEALFAFDQATLC